VRTVSTKVTWKAAKNNLAATGEELLPIRVSSSTAQGRGLIVLVLTVISGDQSSIEEEASTMSRISDIPFNFLKGDLEFSSQLSP